MGCPLETLVELGLTADWQQIIDSTTVRGHSQAAGAKGHLSGGFWSITRPLYNKTHARADGQGRPLGFILTGGEASDYNAVPDLLAIPVNKPKLLLADKGYDGDFLREELLTHGIRPVIPPKATGRTRLPATGGHTRIETASSGCSTASSSSVALRPDTTRPGNPSQRF